MDQQIASDLSVLLADRFPINLPGRYVTAARKALGWSRSDLANRAGVSVTMLSDFETAKRKPMHNNLRAVLRALGAAGIEFAVENNAVIGVRWPQAEGMAGVILSPQDA